MQSHFSQAENISIQDEKELDVKIPLLVKKIHHDRKISKLIGRSQHYPKNKNEVEILVALSKLIWTIEDYFDDVEKERLKEELNQNKKASFTRSGILSSTITGLTAIATGVSAIFYSSPILKKIAAQINNITDYSNQLLSNYTNAVSNIKNQFANTDVPDIQQLCSQIDPNPIASCCLYPKIETNFVNGHCRDIFQNYIDLENKLQRAWVNDAGWQFRGNIECRHELYRMAIKPRPFLLF